MKVEEFRKDFEIDRTAKSPRARQKNGAKPLPEAKTADGKSYNPEEKYFFFDKTGSREIRQTVGLRRIDSDYVGSFGLKICKISELRTNRADALADAQDFYREQIREFQEKIFDLEAEKTGKNE